MSKPDILCVKGLPYNNPPSNHINSNFTIQFIGITYCNDRFSPKTIERKTDKYQALIEDIQVLCWKVGPLIVIAVGARASTFTPSITSLETHSQSPMNKSKKHL